VRTPSRRLLHQRRSPDPARRSSSQSTAIFVSAASSRRGSTTGGWKPPIQDAKKKPQMNADESRLAPIHRIETQNSYLENLRQSAFICGSVRQNLHVLRALAV
jgi:hypothetical protein